MFGEGISPITSHLISQSISLNSSQYLVIITEDIVCSEGYVKCPSSYCISDISVCDDYINVLSCIITEDIVCSEGYVKCPSSYCISDISVCNDYINVLVCIIITEDIVCSEGYVKCPSSYCISDISVCDGHQDCSDGSDELGCSSRSN